MTKSPTYLRWASIAWLVLSVIASNVYADHTPPINKDAIAKVNTIAVVPIPKIEAYKVDAAARCGNLAGALIAPIGSLIVDAFMGGSYGSKSAKLSGKLALLGFDFNAEFPKALEKAFASTRFKLIVPTQPGAPRAKVLDSYAGEDPAAQAILDIVPLKICGGGVGYISEYTHTSYFPTVWARVNLVAQGTNEVLYTWPIVFGATHPAMRKMLAQHFYAAPDRYEFEDFEALMADPELLVEGLRFATNAVAVQIARELDEQSHPATTVVSTQATTRAAEEYKPEEPSANLGGVPANAPLKIAILPYAGYFPFDGLSIGNPERRSDPFSKQIVAAITETVPDTNIVIARDTLVSDGFQIDADSVWTKHTAEELRPNVSLIISEARRQSVDVLITVFWRAYGIQQDIQSSHLFVINAHTGEVLDRIVRGESVQTRARRLLAKIGGELGPRLRNAQISSARASSQPTPKKQFASSRPGTGAGAAPSFSPYRVAIFPGFHSTWPRCEAANTQLGKELTERLRRDNKFNVKLSAFPYDAREQVTQEYMWSARGKPKSNLVYSTALRYGVDVALMASMDCEGKSGAIPTRLHMIDVHLRRTYSVSGYASKVLAMLRKVKARYESGRKIARKFTDIPSESSGSEPDDVRAAEDTVALTRRVDQVESTTPAPNEKSISTAPRDETVEETPSNAYKSGPLRLVVERLAAESETVAAARGQYSSDWQPTLGEPPSSTTHEWQASTTGKDLALPLAGAAVGAGLGAGAYAYCMASAAAGPLGWTFCGAALTWAALGAAIGGVAGSVNAPPHSYAGASTYSYASASSELNPRDNVQEPSSEALGTWSSPYKLLILPFVGDSTGADMSGELYRKALKAIDDKRAVSLAHSFYGDSPNIPGLATGSVWTGSPFSPTLDLEHVDTISRSGNFDLALTYSFDKGYSQHLYPVSVYLVDVRARIIHTQTVMSDSVRKATRSLLTKFITDHQRGPVMTVASAKDDAGPESRPYKIGILPYAGYYRGIRIAYGKPGYLPDYFYPQIANSISGQFPGADVLMLADGSNSDNPLADPENIWSIRMPTELQPDAPIIVSAARRQGIDFLVALFWEANYRGGIEVQRSRVYVIDTNTGKVLDEIVNGDSIQESLESLFAELGQEGKTDTGTTVASALSTTPSKNNNLAAPTQHKESADKSVPTAPYKLLILPIGGNSSDDTDSIGELSRRALEAVNAQRVVSVAHSFYGVSPDIPGLTTGSVWKGSRFSPTFDLDHVVEISRSGDFDLALTYWFEKGYYQVPYPVSVYLIDVGAGKIHRKPAMSDTVREVTQSLLTKFITDHQRGPERTVASVKDDAGSESRPYKIGILPYAGYTRWYGLMYGKPERRPDNLYPQITNSISRQFPGADVLMLADGSNPDNALAHPENIWNNRTPTELQPDAPVIVSAARRQGIDLLIALFWEQVPRQTRNHLYVIDTNTGKVLDEIVNGDSIQESLESLFAELGQEGKTDTGTAVASARTNVSEASDGVTEIAPAKDDAGSDAGAYKLAILPFNGSGAEFGSGGADQYQTLDAIKFAPRYVSRKRNAMLAHSYYESRSETEAFYEFDKVWLNPHVKGVPNESYLVGVAKNQGIDAVLLVWWDIKGYGTVAYNDVYLVDVRGKRTHHVHGDQLDSRRLFDEVFAKFEKGRRGG